MRLELVAELTDVAAGVAPKLTSAQLVRVAVDVGTHLASSIELQQERDEGDERTIDIKGGTCLDELRLTERAMDVPVETTMRLWNRLPLHALGERHFLVDVVDLKFGKKQGVKEKKKKDERGMEKSKRNLTLHVRDSLDWPPQLAQSHPSNR